MSSAPIIRNLESLLEQGQDSAVLRFSLGSAYLKEKQWAKAIEHLQQAVVCDPEYSAAWKQYGKALVENEQVAEAVAVYQKGIEVAQDKGDIQAVKEMTVFLKRLQK